MSSVQALSNLLVHVEDDLEDQEIMRYIVSNLDLDCQLRSFATGMEMIDWLFEDRAPAHGIRYCPRMILLDLNLPGIDGYEVLKKIRTHSVFCRIPVVITTGSVSFHDFHRAMKLGCNGYVLKNMYSDKVFIRQCESFIEAWWNVEISQMI